MRTLAFAIACLAGTQLFGQAAASQQIQLPTVKETRLQQALEAEQNRLRSGIGEPITVARAGAELAAARAEAFLNEISASASNVTRDEDFIRLRGNVQIRSRGLLIEADEADYDLKSGQLDPRGNVRITRLR